MWLSVYTCIAGGITDNLTAMVRSLPATPEESQVEFVCFTDRQAPSIAQWDVRPLAMEHWSPRRTARYHKLNSHLLFPQSEYTCWLDGNLTFKPGVDPCLLVQQYLTQTDLATFQHPVRTCVYEELEACLRLKKDSPELMRAQIARYRQEGYPPYLGMAETSCVLRRNSPAMSRFNAAWWQELEGGSLRDQLSFNYVLWKLGLSYTCLQGCRAQSPYFHFQQHR